MLSRTDWGRRDYETTGKWLKFGGKREDGCRVE
jgi:hypothetical protein